MRFQKVLKRLKSINPIDFLMRFMLPNCLTYLEIPPMKKPPKKSKAERELSELTGKKKVSEKKATVIDIMLLQRKRSYFTVFPC